MICGSKLASFFEQILNPIVAIILGRRKYSACLIFKIGVTGEERVVTHQLVSTLSLLKCRHPFPEKKKRRSFRGLDAESIFSAG